MNVTDIEKIAEDLTNQATSVAHHYGPQAWAIMCGVKRVDSIGALAMGVGGLVFAIAFIVAFVKFGLWMNTQEWASLDENPMILFYWGFGTMIAVFLFFNLPSNLTDIWNWVGAINPGLAIAHDVITKALSH